MARHREFDETEALDAAMGVFWSRGYEGTSIQDLETSTGLTRTSIYNAFGNKRQLFERVLAHYQQTVLSQLLEQLNSGKTVQDGVRDMMYAALNIHFRQDTPGGCLVVLSVLEREQHDTQSAQLLEKIIQQLQKFLRKRIRDAQKAGELDKNIDAGPLSTTIATTMAGTMVMGKAGFSRAALKKVVDTTCQLLDA